MRLFLVFFVFAGMGALAEIFEFKEVPMPDDLSFSSYYMFHVYATPALEQPQPRNASVTFKNFEIKSADGKGIGDYQGLQVALVPWSKFWTLIDKASFCSSKRTVDFTDKSVRVPVFNVGAQQEATLPFSMTDEYLLTVTNCGDKKGLTVLTGQVIVFQPHGFLPGNKVWTLQWWGWFSMVNALLCIVWVIAAARHYQALVHVQKMITVCAVMAFSEAALGYFQYKEWNASGIRSVAFLAATMLAYSLKYTLTLRMMIETAAGAGVTMARLEMRSERKLNVICELFLVLQSIWKVILSYKYRFMITPSFCAAITIPGTLLWLLIFVWIYRQFQTLMLQMQDKKLASEAVNLFINLRLVLVGSILLATVVSLLQFTDIWMSRTPWNLQWVPYDGAPHSVYTLFLLAMMILWWPREDSWKLGYADQVKQDEDMKEQCVEHRSQAETIGVEEEL